nr:MAG TPA: hypothetical protein [Caudoviricetes sp.]
MESTTPKVALEFLGRLLIKAYKTTLICCSGVPFFSSLPIAPLFVYSNCPRNFLEKCLSFLKMCEFLIFLGVSRISCPK